MKEMKQLRKEVYKQFNSISCNSEFTDEASNNAWHLITYYNNNMIGCIRYSIFDLSQVRKVPNQVLINSECHFTKDDTKLCLAALSEYTLQWYKNGGLFVQIGGLAVRNKNRHSIVGIILALASRAFMKLVNSEFSVFFVAKKTHGDRLYKKLGGEPLDVEGRPLGCLTDSFHQDQILIMYLKKKKIDYEKEINELYQLFQYSLDKIQALKIT
ncbi:MAG: hypothetical protein QNJ74_20515 [Trichodesmium sp. MO_231.B1]|nr:hypothetical protein [Trichodesmium sp. MO_231.B1]